MKIPTFDTVISGTVSGCPKSIICNLGITKWLFDTNSHFNLILFPIKGCLVKCLRRGLQKENSYTKKVLSHKCGALVLVG